MAQGLCQAPEPVTAVFCSLRLRSCMSAHPPLLGCVRHSAFPGLSCVSHKGRGLAVEINSSEVFPSNTEVLAHSSWPELGPAPQLPSGPATSCVLEHEAAPATGVKKKKRLESHAWASPEGHLSLPLTLHWPQLVT